MLLTVSNIVKRFGPEPILDGAGFDVRPGDRIGLVGPNGTGKTTLLRIVAGLEDSEKGEVTFGGGVRLGFLEQHPEFTENRTVREEAQLALGDLMQMVEEAEKLANELAEETDEARRKQIGKRFDELQHQLQERDGYNLDYRVDRILTGLGFEQDAFDQPTQQLSGGQQNRLMLAKLLLESADLLLLDEPSNHLDIDATLWLEDFLLDSRQAILVVSHDRYFLDRVTNRTLELYQGTTDSYPGNYSKYLRLKAERLEVQKRTYEKQQIEIAKMEEFVRRHHAGQKHLQAEDRRKKLERIERVPPPREIQAPPMGFPPAERSGDIVLRVERLAKAYDKPLFKDLTFDLLRGERWGILGPNGCGKTTLLKCLLEQIESDEGRVNWGTGVKPAYFDQMIACLESDDLAVDSVRPDHKEFYEPQRRDMLARFGIVGDMVFQKVSSLSGGERNRTALAMLSATDSNLLVLDEPTNHLDLWARTSLESSLVEFDGTVLFVSHDRYFLNQVADHLIAYDGERFRVIEGNYDTYLHFRNEGLIDDHKLASSSESKKSESKATKPRPEKLAKPKRKFPYRKIEEIEADIAVTELHIADLHEQLADPDVLRDGRKVKEVQAMLETAQNKMQQLLEHWEEASELN